MQEKLGFLTQKNDTFFIIVDESKNVLEVIGDPGDVLRFPLGEVSKSLYSLLNSNLVKEIKMVVDQAIISNKPTKTTILPYSNNNSPNTEYRTFIQIKINPIFGEDNQYKYCLSFNYFHQDDFAYVVEFSNSENYSEQAQVQIDMLKSELSKAKESVTSYIDHLEFTNKSIVESNENLNEASSRYQRLNEQLETSNEELRVSNEELLNAYAEVSNLNGRLKQTQEELIRKEGTLRAIVDNVPGVIYSAVIDSKMNIHFNYISPKVEQIFEVPLLLAIENPKKAFPVHPDELENWIREIKKAVTSKSRFWNSNGRFLYDDGRIFFWEGHATLTHLENGDTILDGVLINTTKQVNAEELSSRLRTEFNEAVKDIVAVVFKFRRREDGEYIYVLNDGFIGESLGITTDKVYGKPLLEVVGEEEAIKLRENYDKVFYEGIMEYEFTFWDRWYYARMLPYSENGKTIGIIGSAIDITEKKNLESRILQSQKMETIGYLAGGIAHDLNNMLQPIFIYANILRDRLNQFDDLKDEIIKIDKILSSVERAKRLVVQVLDFSRNKIESVDKKERVNLLKTLEENLNLLLIDTPPHIETSIDLDIDSSCTIYIDPVKFTQVLMNLINNAIYSMKDNSDSKDSKLTIKAELVQELPQDWLSKKELIHKPGYMVTIEDSGSGMDQDTVDHVFEPFFSNKIAGEGLGLGLSIVKSIIDSTGGSIDVISEIDKGTRFRFYIPCCESSESLIPPKSKSKVGKEKEKSSLKILLVDDDEFTVESIQDLLVMKEIDYKSFYRPVEGIEYFNNNSTKIGLIITDYKMPDMIGTEFVEYIREKNMDVPIILYSGNTLPISQAFLEKHNVTLLEKPLDVEILLENIAKLMKKK